MIDETWYRKPVGIKESLAAGGLVARVENDQVLIALVKEGEQTDYILPKGSVEPGEDLVAAARREIEEEAGLTLLEFIAKIGVQERLNFNRKLWKLIHYFLFTSTHTGSTPTDATHRYICEWFPLDGLPSMFWPEQRELIETNRDRIVALVRMRTG